MFGGDIYVINASFDTKIAVYVHGEEVTVISAPKKGEGSLSEPTAALWGDTLCLFDADT